MTAQTGLPKFGLQNVVCRIVYWLAVFSTDLKNLDLRIYLEVGICFILKEILKITVRGSYSIGNTKLQTTLHWMDKMQVPEILRATIESRLGAYFSLEHYRFLTTVIFMGSASTVHKPFKVMF